MTSSIKELFFRIALYALPVFLIQGIMLYVAWDSIDGRIDDLSEKQNVYISQQQILHSKISDIRSEVAFIKGKISAVNFEKIGLIEEKSRRFPKMGEGFLVSAKSIGTNRKLLSPSEESAFISACIVAGGNTKYLFDGLPSEEIDCFLPLPDQAASEKIFRTEFENRSGIAFSEIGPTR